jgi:hypothetical protein
MEMNMRIMMQRKIRNEKHKEEEENDIFFSKNGDDYHEVYLG